MAQRPTNDFDIDPNVTSGTDLANILNRFQDAMDSGNSGASRPAYLAAGGMWVKEGNPMRLYFYDGTKDIEFYNTTDGLVGASQWKDNGNDIYYDAGNVGIGTENPDYALEIEGSGKEFRITDTGINQTFASVKTGYNNAQVIVARQGENKSRAELRALGNSAYLELEGKADYVAVLASEANGDLTISLDDGVTDTEFMRFSANSGNVVIGDDNGRVGIGGTPSSSAEEIAKEAKDTLAGWKSTFDERLKAEPKADKKAVTLEITGDEFDTLPTEKALVERLTARNIGGGTAKLQVDGDAYFTGDVYANGSPITRATDLIETLSTLREATRDETTLEGLRDALSDAIGGLIQKFEAQISTKES